MQRVAQLHTLKANWDHRQSISAGLHALVKAGSTALTCAAEVACGDGVAAVVDDHRHQGCKQDSQARHRRRLLLVAPTLP